MKQLIFILHGYAIKREWYASIEPVIKSVYPECDVCFPDLKLSTFSSCDPNVIVAELLVLVNTKFEKAKATNGPGAPVPKIILIGHSTGAVLARKLYVAACGENSDAPLEIFYNNKKVWDWAFHVERIILLAGMNRGWTLNAHLYSKTAFKIRIGIIIGRIMSFFGFIPVAFKTRRGAPFITQLRMQWLSMLRHAGKKIVGNAPIIQLLGTKDDLISPEDNVDLITGAKFIYLEVPESDHITVLKMMNDPYAAKRRLVFTQALAADPTELQGLQVPPTDPDFAKIDETVTDVVFVIHGIRDNGYWTQKIARRVKVIGDKTVGRKFATETSTYGYFAMLPFILSLQRKKKVEWLMDQYTENLALYPNAAFSFMGHSNGTYLLARALKDYPACRFKNVLFAGSVVQSGFDWKELIGQKRIENFYNLVASSDYVVAIFPKTFQALGIQDLGSAGFDGFTCDLSKPYQLRYLQGGHGAGTDEKYWDEIANFIVHGKVSANFNKMATDSRSRFMKILGAAAPAPFLIILSIVIAVGAGIMLMPIAALAKVLCMIIYIIGVWKVITWI